MQINFKIILGITVGGYAKGGAMFFHVFCPFFCLVTIDIRSSLSSLVESEIHWSVRK